MFDKLKNPLDKDTKRTMYQRISGWDRDDKNYPYRHLCVHTYVPLEIYVYSLLFYYHDGTPSPMQLIKERIYLGYDFRGLEYKMAEQRHARRKQKASNLNHSMKQKEQTRNSSSLKTLRATSSIVLPPIGPYLLTSTQIVSPTENQPFQGPRYQRHFSFKTLQQK